MTQDRGPYGARLCPCCGEVILNAAGEERLAMYREQDVRMKLDYGAPGAVGRFNLDTSFVRYGTWLHATPEQRRKWGCAIDK